MRPSQRRSARTPVPRQLVELDGLDHLGDARVAPQGGDAKAAGYRELGNGPHRVRLRAVVPKAMYEPPQVVARTQVLDGRLGKAVRDLHRGSPCLRRNRGLSRSARRRFAASRRAVIHSVFPAHRPARVGEAPRRKRRVAASLLLIVKSRPPRGLPPRRKGRVARSMLLISPHALRLALISTTLPAPPERRILLRALVWSARSARHAQSIGVRHFSLQHDRSARLCAFAVSSVGPLSDTADPIASLRGFASPLLLPRCVTGSRHSRAG